MSMRKTMIIPIMIVMMLLGVYVFLHYSSDLLPGSNWANINLGLVAVYPFLLSLAFGFFVFIRIGTGDLNGFFAVPTSSGIGITVCMLLESLNTSGRIVDEFITGSVTLLDMQIITIIIFTLIGIVIAMANR